jgi:ABC-2 type transport system permease protein
MKAVLSIIEKELREFGRDRGLIVGLLLTPAILLGVSVWTLFTVTTNTIDPQQAARLSTRYPEIGSLPPSQMMPVLLLKSFAIFFLMMPVVFPANLAANSVVGEKVGRTLEPILATPISAAELMAGKALSAFIPSALITLTSLVLLAIGSFAATRSLVVLKTFAEPTFLMLFLVWTPLISLISICFTLMISSRAKDARTAFQLSAFGLIPILGLFFLQITGHAVFSWPILAAGTAVLLCSAAFALALAARVFGRETILTKWS